MFMSNTLEKQTTVFLYTCRSLAPGMVDKCILHIEMDFSKQQVVKLPCLPVGLPRSEAVFVHCGKQPLFLVEKDPVTDAFRRSALKGAALKNESDLEKEIKQIEVEGVKKAESGDLQGAIELFTEAINKDISRASGYNNRAQVLRLKADINGALEDLDKAVELSGGEGNAACQAFTQRGLIKKFKGNDDEALEDFKKASLLGSSFAKQMVVTCNPYAALCNQMLTDVITKLRSGQEI